MPDYAGFFASSIAAALVDIEPNEGAIIAFTAHSLPASDLVDDDPYVTGLERVASEVAEQLGLNCGHAGAGEGMFETFRSFGDDKAPRAWYLVYQSKGERPGQWLCPDLEELIDACAASEVRALVVCPVGFFTDHMETLYDLDIIAAERAIAADLEFVRAPVPNDYDALVVAIAESREGARLSAAPNTREQPAAPRS